MTPSDYALRRLQKRRINAKALEKMLKSKDPVLRQTALERFTAEKIRKHLKTTTGKKVAEHPDLRVREPAATALVQYYAQQKNIPELEKLAEHKNPDIRRIAENSLNQLKARKLLLRTKKPFAATAHLPEILKRTKALNEIASQLRKEFGKDFIGIVVFGSTAKGYARPKSDVDYAVIASDQKTVTIFQELSSKQKLPLCEKEHYVNPDTKNTNIVPLFYGLFFGDRKALTQAQKTAFQQISPEEWTRIRTKIYKKERQLGRAFKQYKISRREQQRIRIAAALRVPPPYSEMKKLLGIK